MSNPPPFVLPAGLAIELSGDVVSLAYSGAVHLQQTLGRTLGSVTAGGDVTLDLEVITGQIRSGGKVVANGRIEADTLHGREVVLGDADIRCRAISATERIVIGGARLQVDIILAPEIVFDPKASGRVTVIESLSDPGPTKIKGGFSLQEYSEVFGDPAAFLAERNLQPLRTAANRATPAPAAAPPQPPPESPEPTKPKPAPAPVVAFAGATAEPTPSRARAPAPEVTADPLSLSVEDLLPLADAAPDDPLKQKLLEQVKRIGSCYEGKDLPPAVTQLRELVEARNYPKLKEKITEVWNGLLAFHQRKGIRPHPQVTHAFNVIHGLMQSV
jgi:hypothetical protein